MLQELSKEDVPTKETIWTASWQNLNDLCTQQSLRSVWASAQSDQSLQCAQWIAEDPICFFMGTVKTLIRLGGCPRLIWVFAGHKGHCLFCHDVAHFFHTFLKMTPNSVDSKCDQTCSVLKKCAWMGCRWSRLVYKILWNGHRQSLLLAIHSIKWIRNQFSLWSELLLMRHLLEGGFSHITTLWNTLIQVLSYDLAFL